MGYNELEIGLRKVETQIARWRTLGYLPAIEQQIALRRLQQVYAELLEMPCGEPAEIDPIVPVTGENIATGATGVTNGGEIIPDNERFEPYEPVQEPEGAVIIEEPEPEAIPERGRPAEETHVRQDDEAHDLCPPQLEFPELTDEEPELTEAEEEEVIFEEEEEEEAKQEPELEAVPERGRPAEETHVRQDDEAHDLYPPQLEFPELTDEEPELTEADEEEVIFEEEEEEPKQEPELEAAPAPAENVRRAERPVTKQPEKAVDPTPKEPALPRILGIEVSPYARHEIIDTLFHGNESLFEAETAKLDAMDSLEDALIYLNESYRWIPENAATIKFIDLLTTRFE